MADGQGRRLLGGYVGHPHAVGGPVGLHRHHGQLAVVVCGNLGRPVVRQGHVLADGHGVATRVRDGDLAVLHVDVAADGTDAYTIRTGSIEVLPSFAASVSLDARTHAEKTLEAIEAWIENHDPAVAEYEIAGRRMKYIPIDQLLKMRDQYRREVRGVGGKSGRVYLRF